MNYIFPEIEILNKNTLVIIGNGLDIASGIKSRYKDFEEYLYEKGKIELVSSMYSIFSNNRSLWSDIEKALGEYDETTILS